jgi:superfamily II DNA or RNA helicase
MFGYEGLRAVSACFPAPRPFQETAHEKLREGLRARHFRQLLVAPTGAGKTFLGLRVINEALKKNKTAIFVCDRTALIDQTSARADEYGLTEHGVIQANHPRRNNALPFQICSIQTIQARGYWPPADVIVIDEAHTQFTATKEKLSGLHPGVAVVGLTATPCTKGLGLYFDHMVNAATMKELTDQGILVPMHILTCVTPDMADAKTNSNGEWAAGAASERELQIIGDVVAEWVKHGEGRKTISFGPDIAYCTELVGRFNQAGIFASSYTSETKDAERQELLREFRKPDSQIRVLVSVEALAKGFDVQDIGCVIDARPLRKSLSTAIQMWGRGLRCSPETGKVNCIFLDHSGNFRRFREDFERVYHEGFATLDMAEKLDKVIRKDEEGSESHGCPQCGFQPFTRRCMSCGFEKQTRANAAESAGEMLEIKIGKQVAAHDSHHLWRQLCWIAKTSKKPQGRASHLFKDITGDWPQRDWIFDFTQAEVPTRATENKVRSLNIAFRKRASA